mgnify:CR=1 FL=1
MYEILANIIKYLFVTAIYFFMFSIIRLIYLDIRRSRMGTVRDDNPYLKLLNRRGDLSFRVEESYSVKDKTTLGRGANADITIPDPFLSSVHMQFIKEGAGYAVLDNDSTNGTFVNGDQVQNEPCALKTGDLIKAGQLNFIFVEPEFEEE